MKFHLILIILTSFGFTEYSCSEIELQQCKQNDASCQIESVKSLQEIQKREIINPQSEKNEDKSKATKFGISATESGLLNSLENATIWAIKEERIFQSAKLRYDKLKSEVMALKQYTQNYESTTKKLPQIQKLRADFIASSGIASYLMVMRYVDQLQTLKELLAINHIETYLQEFFRDSEMYSKRNAGSILKTWPNRLDLALAMHSLIHIQEVYNYDYKQFPAALSPETTKPPTLNAFHSAQIGLHALYAKSFAVAIELMEESARMIHNEYDDSIPLPVLESYLELAAKRHNEELTSPRDSSTLFFENLFIKEAKPFQPSVEYNERNSSVVLKRHGGSRKEGFEYAYYNGVCSGKDFRTARDLSSLYCWYDRSSSAARVIQPYKKELLSFEPEVIQVYDFLGDKLVSRLADDRTKCSGISNAFDKQQLAEIMRYRTPTTCWPEHSQLKSLWNKISSLTLTDLRNETIHDLASVQYLPGRFYSVHRDALQLFPLEHLGVQKQLRDEGDRLISMVIYLNDVPAGGWTPFPIAGTAALPVKGSAVFWHNIHRNGSVKEDSWHGACPVIYGHKQAAVIIIRSHSQFRTYPCTLNQYE